MISSENINYSLRNIFGRKTRSILTIISILVGIATIFIFVSYGWGLYDYVHELSTGGSADKFLVQGKGFSAPGLSEIKFNEAELKRVESTRGVSDVAGYIYKVVKIIKKGETKFVFLSSFDPKNELLFESFGIDILKGRKLKSGDTNKVVLGYNYLIDNKIMSKSYSLNEKIEIEGNKYKIVGFMESVGNPQDDSNIYMTKEGLKSIYPDEDDYSIIVGRSSLDNMDQTLIRVEKQIRTYRNEKEGEESFVVQSFQDQIETFSIVLNILIIFIILIALISVFVSAINTANTMVTSVLERVKEIGVIKSVGAKNSDIFNIFLFESSVLGFIAGVVGVLIGYIISEIGAIILTNLGWSFLQPHISNILFLGCIIFSTLVGGLSGMIPAYHASKLKPTEALRYE